MATTVARLEAVLGADTGQFDKAMDRSQRTMGSIGGVAGKAFKAVGVAAIAGGAAVGAGLKVSIDNASNLGESMNAVSVVFGKSSKIITEFGEGAAKKTGLSMRALNELVTPIGAALINTGMGADVAAKASVNLAQRAADMASVFNVDVSEALGAIQAGLRGEADPLERFGVGLSAAATQAHAMEMGLAKTTKELTAQDTAQARLALIMEQTNRVAGDFANTSDGLANSQRIMKAELENTTAQLGQALLPVAAKVMSALAQLVPKFLEWGSVLMDKLQPAFVSVVSWVQTNWPTIQTVVGTVFQALGTFWAQYGKPALQAMKDVTEELVRVTRENWPTIQAVIQKVVDWFNTHLKPTIQSVVDNIKEHWGSIKKATKDTWESLDDVIKPALEALEATINSSLAIIRGDWETAWEEIGDVPGKALKAAAKGMMRPEIFNPFTLIGEALGKALAEGIPKGLDALEEILRDKLTSGINNAIDAVKGVFGIRSPSVVTAEKIGKPLGEGIAMGILEKKLRVAEALVEVLNAAVDKAKSRMSQVGGTLSSVLSNAFSAKQNAILTPTEQLLKTMQEGRAEKALQSAVAESGAALTAIQAEEARRREEVLASGATDTQERLAAIEAEFAPLRLAAGQAFADAQAAVLVAGLEKQAAAERVELNGRLEFERINFNNRLSALQGYLDSGEATTAGATARIRTFMADFGIGMGEVGELLGLNYAAGIRNLIPAAVDAANDLRVAVERALKGQASVANIEKAIERAKAAADRANAKARDINKHFGLPSGDRGPAPVVGGPAGGSGGNTTTAGLASFARSLGFNPSSGQLTGGTHTKGSLHYSGKAVDMSGTPAAMRNAFFAAIQTYGSKIDELFYDPIGWYLDKGQKIGGAIGGHKSHVHLGVFDKGGWLPPRSKTLAINNSSMWEPVGPPGRGRGDVHLHFHGDMYGQPPRQFFKQVRDGLRELDVLQTGGRVLSAAPTLT